MVGLLKDWLVDPVALLFLLSQLIWLKCLQRAWRRRSSRVARVFFSNAIWVVTYLFCTAPIIVNPLLLSLEDLYPDAQLCESGSHVVVLGGGVDSRATSPDEFERMSPATLSRASEAVRLIASEPETMLIAAGGVLRGVSETAVMSNYWQVLGIDVNRIIENDRSSNTRENAIQVREVLQGQPVAGTVRLVTSALHMPRALASFNKVFADSGVEFCPVSTDRQGLKNLPRFAFMPQTSSLVKFDLWLHEVVALIVYKVKAWL